MSAWWVAHKQGATNLNSYTYTFDGLSRPTSVVSTAEGTSSYSYDTISQVTGATHIGQSNETYGFDANGNRNTTGYTIGTNNQTTAGLGFTFTYDNQGNRLTRTETSTGKAQSYEWDFRNPLTAVINRNTSGGAIVQRVDYEYDAYNRLVKRSLDADVPIKLEGPYGPFKPGTKRELGKITITTPGIQIEVEVKPPSNIDFDDAIKGHFRSIIEHVRDNTNGVFFDGINIRIEAVR